MAKTDPVASKACSLLNNAARSRTVVGDREPWDYGWAFEKYRHSSVAAMSSLHGPIALSADGVDDFESAVRLLLKDKRIHQRWEEEEFWSLIVSAIATLPMNDESADIPRRNCTSGLSRHSDVGQ